MTAVEEKKTSIDIFLENTNTVSIPLLDLYFSIFKAIYKKDKKAINGFVVKPLRDHFKRNHIEDTQSLLATLEHHRKSRGVKIMGTIYRKLLQQATFEPHPKEIFKVISRLLLDLEAFEKFRSTEFSLEFIKIFRNSFYEFEKSSFEELEKDFEKRLNSNVDEINASDLGKKKLEEETKEKLNAEAENLFNKIEKFYVMGNVEKVTYFLAQFTGRFCNFPNVAYRDDIDKIIDDLASNNPEVKKEISERLAIKIFREIVSAVNSGSLKKAIRGISTFALTFQEKVDVPYRKELDRLEEKLYQFISEKNLWDKLKV